jgi:SPP1 family predicted phage head-tail adaptor
MADFAVSIADMRTRITFQSPTVSTDAGAAQSNTYANVSTNPTVWARWVNAHGVEAVTSEALESVQRATVTVRYRTDIKSTWQILKDGEAWKIISVDEVQDRNRWIELIVERIKGSV